MQLYSPTICNVQDLSLLLKSPPSRPPDHFSFYFGGGGALCDTRHKLNLDFGAWYHCQRHSLLSMVTNMCVTQGNTTPSTQCFSHLPRWAPAAHASLHGELCQRCQTPQHVDRSGSCNASVIYNHWTHIFPAPSFSLGQCVTKESKHSILLKHCNTNKQTILSVHASFSCHVTLAVLVHILDCSATSSAASIPATKLRTPVLPPNEKAIVTHLYVQLSPHHSRVSMEMKLAARFRAPGSGSSAASTSGEVPVCSLPSFLPA